MSHVRRIRHLILAAAGPACAMLVVAMFAGYAVLGTNGLLARAEYRKQADRKQQQLTALKKEHARLENRKLLLQRGDADLADELTRGATDMVGEDEYVILIP